MMEPPTLRESFYSAFGKCQRGLTLIKWLESEYKAASKPAEVVHLTDQSTGIETVKLIVYPCPPFVPLVIGEIIHNLRNSLDYLISSIVSNASGRPETRVGFPFHETKSGFLGSRSGHRLYQLVPDVWDIIENEFPPYRDEGGNAVLWAINRLNNNDKHRLLNISNAAGAAAGDVFAPGGGQQSSVWMQTGCGEMILDQGFNLFPRLEVTSDLVLIEENALGKVSLFPFLFAAQEICNRVGFRLQGKMFGDEKDSGELAMGQEPAPDSIN